MQPRSYFCNLLIYAKFNRIRLETKDCSCVSKRVIEFLLWTIVLPKALCYNILRIYTARGAFMKVSYRKLWILCAEREMSKAELRKRAGLSSATFTKLRKNQEVTLAVILKIADVLNCNAGDMMDFIKDDEYAEIEDIGVEEVW